MKKRELAQELGLTVSDVNRVLIEAGHENLVNATLLPEKIVSDIRESFARATAATPEPEPQQPKQPTPPQDQQPAPNLTHKPAESLAEQQTETREQAKATDLRIDEILASKSFQTGTIDANLHHLFYRQGYTQQSLENKLQFLGENLATIDQINAAKLDRANLYELAEKLGAKLPQQTFSDLCQITHNTEQSTQLLETLGKLR